MPPVFSGYPSSNREGWAEFRAEYRRTHGRMWEEFDAFVRDNGAPGLSDGPCGPEFIH